MTYHITAIFKGEIQLSIEANSIQEAFNHAEGMDFKPILCPGCAEQIRVDDQPFQLWIKSEKGEKIVIEL